MSNTPQIRFAGFTDAWEQRKLGDMMNVTSVKRIHQSDWTSSGVRFLRARDIVALYKNEEPSDYLYISEEKYNEYSSLSGKVKVGDLLVTGVGTIGVPMLINDGNPLYFKDGNVIWFQNENKINGDFFYYSFIGNAIQSFIQESAGTGTVGTYTIDSGKKTPISLPTNESEQQKIGNYFRNLDHLITLHQRKCDALQKFKKSMLQKMFPQNGESVPEIRFAGFTDAWEQRKVGELTVESSEYTTLEAGFPLLTSSRNGLMYQNEYRGKQTTDSTETMFSIVPLGACTYRHMSDDDVFHLNVNRLEKGLVSREYPVFYASDDNNLDFIVQQINSSAEFRSFCAEQKKGGTRTRLYYKNLCEFQMLIPNTEEQEKIATFLLTLDTLITLHQRKLETLQKMKKSLLQKMFV